VTHEDKAALEFDSLLIKAQVGKEGLKVEDHLQENRKATRMCSLSCCES
jgi:hypothetical protein